MNNREKLYLLGIFVGVLLLSSLCSYYIFKPHEEIIDNTKVEDKKEDKKETKEDNVLKVGVYTLNYGKYKGTEDYYNQDTGKTEKKEKTIILTKETINNEKYEVKDNMLYVNGYSLYEVKGNNKLYLLAGSGVEYNYEKE